MAVEPENGPTPRQPSDLTEHRIELLESLAENDQLHPELQGAIDAVAPGLAELIREASQANMAIPTFDSAVQPSDCMS